VIKVFWMYIITTYLNFVKFIEHFAYNILRSYYVETQCILYICNNLLIIKFLTVSTLSGLKVVNKLYVNSISTNTNYFIIT